ncbi:hypothetical protein RF11_05586 [Thelohanellus kitauei]|uniref:Uncharacterized protein n=1 Tax=Thelohanellus kitauei TaxID=669202 RepID=A0A0C2IUJ0_THEKT|nr:hypothetical protein RF11_05586 [Thelohanellus kitauei]
MFGREARQLYHSIKNNLFDLSAHLQGLKIDIAQTCDKTNAELCRSGAYQKIYFDLSHKSPYPIIAGWHVYKKIHANYKTSKHWEEGWIIARLKGKCAKIVKNNQRSQWKSMDRLKPYEPLQKITDVKNSRLHPSAFIFENRGIIENPGRALRPRENLRLPSRYENAK